MNGDKKRVKPKPLKKVEPKKRPVGAKGLKIKLPIIKETKQYKADDNKYLRIPCGEADKFREISERIKNGELRWSYYTTENEKGVHYYLIINIQ